MTIKELEKRTGLPRTTIRFYEQEELLCPERRENNYRDYSEEDVRTLEKIKLLRQLSLDLEAIRRLQAGKLTLGEALGERARALEGDQADLERYAQVCREIRQTGAGYGELDPEPWLKVLEEKSLPPSRRVDPAEQDSIAAAPYPSRRFYARALDLALAMAVWKAFQFFGLHIHGPELGFGKFLYLTGTLWGGWAVLMIFEPILLAAWGYTPGKWILGLKVRREDGRKLAWDDAVVRTALVFLYGLGLGIPFVRLWRLGDSQDRCRKEQVLPWDKGVRYTARPVRLGRSLGMALCLLAAAGLNWLVEDASWRIPHPEGPLTQAQVVENYNFLVERADDRVPMDHDLPQLNADGTWRTAPSAYLDGGDWVDVDVEESEWGSVEFSTDEQGFVTGLTLTWSPQENPYTKSLDLWPPALEYLPDLMCALSPGGQSWRFPWEETWHERRWVEAAGSVSALVNADFTQTGIFYVERRQMPGLRLVLEVVESQGYQLTATPGLLHQEDPGNGKLVLRFTLISLS